MINNDNYMNFIADSKLPNGNRDEDLYFLFKDTIWHTLEAKKPQYVPYFNFV